MLAKGFEVEWISDYRPSPETVDLGEFDPDAVVWSTRDFTSILKAVAFAKRIRHKSPVMKVSFLTEFKEQPNEFAPGLIERVYIGDKKEFS